MNQAQILEEIHRALAGDRGPDSAMTIPEMAALMIEQRGWGSQEVMRRRLRELMPDLIRQGVFYRVKVRREAVDGRDAQVIGYVFRAT